MSTYCYRRTVQWSECDPAGIIFFPRYAEWMVDGLNAFLVELGFDPTATLDDGSSRGLPCVAYSSNFRVPPKLSDHVTHRIEIEHVGTSSLVVHHYFLRGEEVLAEAEDTRVFVLNEQGRVRPMSVPETLRAKLTDDELEIRPSAQQQIDEER